MFQPLTYVLKIKEQSALRRKVVDISPKSRGHFAERSAASRRNVGTFSAKFRLQIGDILI
jgi:hypothetical protein